MEARITQPANQSSAPVILPKVRMVYNASYSSSADRRTVRYAIVGCASGNPEAHPLSCCFRSLLQLLLVVFVRQFLNCGQDLLAVQPLLVQFGLVLIENRRDSLL